MKKQNYVWFRSPEREGMGDIDTEKEIGRGLDRDGRESTTYIVNEDQAEMYSIHDLDDCLPFL